MWLVLSAALAVEVKVDNTGEGDMAEAVYAFEVGRLDPVTVRIDLDSLLDLGDTPTPRNTPSYDVVLKPEILRLDANVAAIELTVADIKLSHPNEALPEGFDMPALFKTTTGAVLDLRVDDHGLIQKLEWVEGVENPLEAIRTAVHHAIVPLPRTAIAEGATWQVTRPVELHGVNLEETSSYVLESSKPGALKTKVNVTHRVLPETRLLGLPPETQATVMGLNSKGIGTSILDPKQLFPTDITYFHALDARLMVVDGSQGEKVISIGLKSKTKLTLAD